MQRAAPLLCSVAVRATAAPALACGSNDPAGIEPPEVPLRARARVAPGVELVAIRTGWVGIKAAHWRYSAPALLAFPRILLGRHRREWLPVISYAVVTASGVVRVDTGADPELDLSETMACDPGAAFDRLRPRPD